MFAFAALHGACIGVFAAVTIGLSTGAWVTARTAHFLAEETLRTVVAAALMPYCVDRATSDPKSVRNLGELSAARGFDRRIIVERAGWATPLGSVRRRATSPSPVKRSWQKLSDVFARPLGVHYVRPIRLQRDRDLLHRLPA